MFGFIVTAELIMLSVVAQAVPFQVTIQPIIICDDRGLNCGNPTEELFFAETRKIWAQAKIDVTFPAFNQFNHSGFLSIGTSASALLSLRDAAINVNNAEPQIINMWFVDNLGAINPETGEGSIFGNAFIRGNGIAIADETFSFNGGNGRLDTVAHEIGHNLALNHASALGDNFNLMQAGGSRLSPNTIGYITPDGSGFDQISQSQLGVALTSLFITEADELVGPGGIAMRHCNHVNRSSFNSYDPRCSSRGDAPQGLKTRRLGPFRGASRCPFSGENAQPNQSSAISRIMR
jgi:hypothetical protein